MSPYDTLYPSGEEFIVISILVSCSDLGLICVTGRSVFRLPAVHRKQPGQCGLSSPGILGWSHRWLQELDAELRDQHYVLWTRCSHPHDRV